MPNPTLPIVALSLALLAPGAARCDDPPAIEPGLPENLPVGWYARIETSMGRIVARLHPEQAPQAVAQFAALAGGELERADPLTGEVGKCHFYDGVSVYLATAGIRFEAGDPTGVAHGGPSLWVSPQEGHGLVDFLEGGRLGMNLVPGRGASPYGLIVTAWPQPRFVGQFPCFGSVVSGLDVVARISEVKTHPSGRPIEPVVIEQVRVFSVGDPPPLAEPVSYEAKRKKLAPRRPPGER